MIRVLLADDQAMIRSGLRSLLDAEPDVEVIAEAEDGREAVDLTRRHKPDVVLMDIRMPVLDGIEATRLVVENSDARVLVLTTYDLDEYVFEALRAGASGLLLKDATAEQLVGAVRILAAGEALLDPSVTRRVIDAFVNRRAELNDQKKLELLTGRELEVLRLMAEGQSNAEIAEGLYVSQATVKSHVSRVLAKLGLRDRVHAVICAYEYGLVGPGARPDLH